MHLYVDILTRTRGHALIIRAQIYQVSLGQERPLPFTRLCASCNRWRETTCELVHELVECKLISSFHSLLALSPMWKSTAFVFRNHRRHMQYSGRLSPGMM